MIELFRLRHVAHKQAGELSYGQQKLIDIAMAFMSEPALVLLDEPCAGVNPSLVGGISALLKELNKSAARRQLRRDRAQHGLHHGAVPPHHVMVEGKVLATARRRRSAPTGRCSMRILATDVMSQRTSSSSTTWSPATREPHDPQQAALRGQRGKITLLLGPNGAGKSTVLKTLFGLLKVRQGRILLDGKDITGAEPEGAAVAARHRVRAAGPQPVRPAHRVRKPRARRHHAGHEDHARAHPRGAGAVPARQGAAGQPGVVAVGRRAEAARGRPRAAAAAQGAADRRAVDRAVAARWCRTCSSCCAGSPTAAPRC